MTAEDFRKFMKKVTSNAKRGAADFQKPLTAAQIGSLSGPRPHIAVLMRAEVVVSRVLQTSSEGQIEHLLTKKNDIDFLKEIARLAKVNLQSRRSGAPS